MLSKLLEKTLKIYQDEQKAFLWMAGLLFLIRASGILLENYAETAFLKRYGVEYLPNIFIINAVFLFFSLTYIGLLIDKYERTALLVRIFFILAAATVLLRILIMFKVSIAYPVLYLISFQLKNALDIIFWTIANSLFNTRQAKRIYPAVISGGILGIILGSLFTSPIARIISMDNILFVSAGIMVLGSFMTIKIKKILVPVLQSKTTAIKKKTKEKSALKSLGEIFPLIKSSQLLRVFLVLVIVPATLLPIFNYQWGVITNRAFTSEGGLIAFYGYFKGIYNVLTFFILFFMGRIFSRFGIAKLLFIHPVNYFLVFVALMFRFDLIVAIYGRVSTNIFRSTTNRPALNMLLNLFPPDARGRVSAFLRGTALRIGGLLGSGILFSLKGFVAPEVFSYIAACFCAVLVFSCYLLKRIYSEILLKNLMETQIDLKAFGGMDLKRLIDDNTKKRLYEGLDDPNENVSILSAKILAHAGVKGLSRHFMDILPAKSARIKKELLRLISTREKEFETKDLLELYQNESPDIQPFVIRAIGKLDPKEHIDLLSGLTGSDDLLTKKEAIIAVYAAGDQTKIEQCRNITKEMLASQDNGQIMTALDILRQTGDESFYPLLMENLDSEPLNIRSQTIKAVGELRYKEATEKLFNSLENENPAIRKMAVQALGKIWKEEK